MAAAPPPVVAASAVDLPAILALLEDARLPSADLTDATSVRFWLVRDRDALVGSVALERHGDVGLLRSLAVREDLRGTGLGRALLKHAEHQASAEGLEALCLLTTTAADLFARHGYERIPRSDAPEAARRSEEFRSLCPDSAVCMIKRLPTR